MAITFGLDISHHQDLALDLAQCRRDGCEFVFLKATEGATFTDSEFAANLAEARAAGMLVAAYVYQRAGVSAAAHVERVKAVVPRDVPVIPDVEANSGSLALTRDMINGLRAAGYRVPLLYLPLWYWRDHLGSPSLGGLPPLWSSRYPDNGVGTLPEEWAEVPARYWDGYGGLPVAVLQFTSSARIAGHQPLDANAYRGTRTELAALLGGQGQEDDMDANQDRMLREIATTLLGEKGPGGVFPDPANGYITVQEYAKRTDAKLTGLVAAVAALSNDQDLTKDEVERIIRDAVKQNIQITGEVHIGPATTSEVAQ